MNPNINLAFTRSQFCTFSTSQFLNVYARLLLAKCSEYCLRQGVRSGAQLSYTETRFQFESETPNVIYIYGLQCDFMQKNRKKHSKYQNRRFYYVNSAPELRNHQKYLQTTVHSIAIYLNFFHRYCVF